MKTEISRDSHQPEKRYSGVYQQQGRMLTDADWNELVDIVKEQLRGALKDVVGDGSPRKDAVLDNDGATPQLRWGLVYVDGIQGAIRPRTDAEKGFDYDNQADFPEAPKGPDDGVYYVDLWERVVTQLSDGNLRDAGLHGADTCTRTQVIAQVKVSPSDEELEKKNPKRGDAQVTITLVKASTHHDPCDPCAGQVEVASRVGNYLFRLEVHDVVGDANAPDEITLKWSAENGAIQYGLLNGTKYQAPPTHFTAGSWAYEYFDETTERHLGVHLLAGWRPSRCRLASEFVDPTGTKMPSQAVRRWDGFCTLVRSKSTWSASAARFDRFKKEDFVFLDGSKLTLALDAHNIVLDLAGSSFVAGDYWLAPVREAEHAAGATLIANAPPVGIEHHYLRLGVRKGKAIEKNIETDRKYAFPPLTEMTRMFIAGGDGQEVTLSNPATALPLPLCIGVANGEWPVKGAKVRFKTTHGTLVPLDGIAETGDDGIAKCSWTPGGLNMSQPPAWPKQFELAATLVDPADSARDLDHPPLQFRATLLSASQVAYIPNCPPTEPDAGNNANLHHLLLGPDDSRLGLDGYYTVKEVLDALLRDLKAGHIPFDDKYGSTEPSVRALLGSLDVDGDNHITVQDALDKLLSSLKARHIPYEDQCDPASPTVRSLLGDLDANPNHVTVQKALQAILCRLNAGHIPYNQATCGPAPSVSSLIVNLDANTDGNLTVKDVLDTLLCKLEAKYIPYDPHPMEKRWEDINDTSVHPTTIQAALDNLADNLHSEDLKYTLPACGTSTDATRFTKTHAVHDALANPALKNYLESFLAHEADDPADQYRIKAVLDALLCNLDATTIPLNKADPGLCKAIRDSSETKTVQDALKLLCERRAGGCCTITVTQDDDLTAIIAGLSPTDTDTAHICVAPGNHLVKSPLLIDGFRNITIEGSGPGSFIEAPNSEAVFIITNCQNVTIRGVSLRAGALGNSGSEDHLNGALTIREASHVLVENVLLNCASGGERLGTCLTVSGNTLVNSVRIAGCRLTPGEQQVGILLVNVDRAIVDDNEIRVRPRSKNSTFASRIKNKAFRRSIGRLMISNVSVAETSTETLPENTVQIPYDGKYVLFRTAPELVNIWRTIISKPLFGRKQPVSTVWQKYIQPEPGLDDLTLRRYLNQVADSLILKTAQDGTEFTPWLDLVKLGLPAIASQGIVCAGRTANDVTLSRNLLYGVAEGIHVGLSHPGAADGEFDSVTRLVITGNHIVNFVSPQIAKGRNGVFVGNCDSAWIENNQLQLMDFPARGTNYASGIRLIGHLGEMVQIRGNRTKGYSMGIMAKAIDATEEPCLWQVENNLLAGAVPPMLDPSDKFISNNTVC